MKKQVYQTLLCGVILLSIFPNYAQSTLQNAIPGLQIASGYYDPDLKAGLPFILRSTDNGQTWMVAHHITSPSDMQQGLLFGSNCIDQTCITYGQYLHNDNFFSPLLLTSSDSGNTWVSAQKIIGLPPYNDVMPTSLVHSKNTYITVGGADYQFGNNYQDLPIILTSDNAGQFWTTKSILHPPFNFQSGSLNVVNCTGNICSAAGYWSTDKFGDSRHNSYPFFVLSQDNGRSWSYVSKIFNLPPNLTGAEIIDMNCLNSICVAAGLQYDGADKSSRPLLLTSFNLGASWNAVQSISGPVSHLINGMLGNINCTTRNLCLATGIYGKHQALILSSHDHGQSWSIVENIIGLSPHLKNRVFFNSTCEGKVCLISGSADATPLIIRSTDNGQSWSVIQNIDLPPHLKRGWPISINCTKGICTASGLYELEDGISHILLLTSQDAGQTWSYVSAFTSFYGEIFSISGSTNWQSLLPHSKKFTLYGGYKNHVYEANE